MQENGGELWKKANKMFGKPRQQWKTVDEMIYGVDNYYNTSKDSYKIRNKAIIEAFNFHYKNNLFYNQFCKHRKLSPSNIKSEKDFHKIPMIPDSFFKDYPSENPMDVYNWLYQVSSVDIGKFDFQGKKLQNFLEWAERRLEGIVLHSSGTSGKFSIMFRDAETMKRLFHILIKLVMFHITKPVRDDIHFVYPGTPKTYLAMGHALGTASQIFDDEHKHFLTDRALNMEIVRLMSSGKAEGLKQKLELALLMKAMAKGQYTLLNLLQNLEKNRKQVILISFPFQIWDLMDIMEKKGIKLNLGDTNSFMATAGGWKIYSHKKVTEEDFARRIEKMFGIPKENYRDAYGMSEMNGLALSCEERYKHLTDWIYPIVLDDEMEPVGFGEWGRFAFLDPAGYGYPGFIMSGDKVRLLEKCPKCDKTGIVLDSEISRIGGAEARGCGNLMRNLLSEKLTN
ncbi:hypothetical protein AYK24_03485 [Thermoplasmatales archaeon SG8-52-4]|nr:MAG: hypothetical protein AYK24_03485 [Thermoplasmatales archaeon SG8-52-4]